MIRSMIDKLTSSYRNDEDSNIVKVIKMIGNELEILRDTFFTIDSYRNIENANGLTLDNIGSNVGEFRGQKNDELYRQYIKTKIKANLSGGEMETLIEVLNILFDGNLKSVKETWNVKDGALYDGEPANLVITFYSTPKKIPYEVIDRVTAGGVGAFYFNEEIRARWLNLETRVENKDSFHRHIHTFECGENEPNLTEGGFGVDGQMRFTDLTLDTRVDVMERYNKFLNLESNIKNRDIIFKFSDTFNSNEYGLLEGGVGEKGQIRGTTSTLETKVDGMEQFNKFLNLETNIRNRDVLFKFTDSFKLTGLPDELLEGGTGVRGHIRKRNLNFESKVTNEEIYNKVLAFGISNDEIDVLFKYSSTFSAGQEVLI